jgi:hypothetical protein
MSHLMGKILDLVERGQVVVSEHGYDELSKDRISVKEVVDGVVDATVLEDYPEYSKGPCVLVLQKDTDNRPFHAVWGIPRGQSSPAVLVTAYRPDPERWTGDFLRRKK